MRRRIRSIALTSVVIATLAGCSTNPATGRPELVMRGEKSEVELGKQMHAQILAQSSAYTNSELQEYVNEIGQKLAAVSERSHLEFKFLVLDDDIVNAFALPGGFIYVTRGLLAHLNSEAELAAVLGHEIGHVTARHSVKRETSGNLLNIASAVATVATGTSMAGQAVSLPGAALISGYNRDQELEADALGAKYIAAIGYPSEATASAIELLKRREQFEKERALAEGREARTPHGIFSTHPDNDKRLAEAVQAAKTHEREGQLGFRQQEFLQRIDGLRWGPSKTPGSFRNNMFYNGRYGVKIRFPENWRVGGEPARLQAVSPDNLNTLQVFALRVNGDLTPQQILQKRLQIQAVKDGKETTIAGMPAYIATVDRYQSPYGAKPARVATVLDPRRRIAYVFAGSGKRDLSRVAADGDFIASIFSLDRMKRSEAQLAKTAKVAVITADASTTIAEMAKESAVPSFAEQQLRLINGLYPAGEPEPGQLIKTVN